MTDNVVTALKNIIANRQKPTKEWLIDGVSTGCYQVDHDLTTGKTVYTYTKF